MDDTQPVSEASDLCLVSLQMDDTRPVSEASDLCLVSLQMDDTQPVSDASDLCLVSLQMDNTRPVSNASDLCLVSLQMDDTRPVSDASDLSPPVPQRPSHSILESIRIERALELAGVASEANQNESGASHDTDGVVVKQDPDYQEIDVRGVAGKSPMKSPRKSPEKSVGKLVARTAGPPEVRIERKMFSSARPPLSVASSMNGSEEMLLELPWSSRLPDAKPTSQASVVPPVSASCLVSPVVTQQSYTSLSLPPPHSNHTSLSLPPPHSNHTSLSLPPPHSNHTVSALATLPRRRHDATRAAMAATSSADTHIVDRRLAADADKTRGKPPTPPMRRQPSWVRL